MQSMYISKLMELAEKDGNILHLVADSGTGYDEMFRRNFPNQIFNFGIAEGHMVSAAAGMASAGKIPFVYTAGAFLAYRAFEFIRDDVCFQNLNVKLVGMGTGLSWSSLGPTHHTTEEIAVLRCIPNLRILSPATPNEVAACVELAYKYDGPVYIRIGMNHEKEYFEENHKVSFEKNEVVKSGKDITIFVTGSILEEVMNAAEMLEQKNISVEVVNIVSVKPFDKESVCNAVDKSKMLVSVEEHNILGGIGSMIADVIVEEGVQTKLLKIGLNDSFAVGYGTHQSVRMENRLDAKSICERILEKY